MKTRKRILNLLVIALMGLGLLLAGCSELNHDGATVNDSNPVAPKDGLTQPQDDLYNNSARGTLDGEGGDSESGRKLPPMDLTRYEYPAEANIPPPGYQFVEIGQNNPGTTEDGWVYTYIRAALGGELWLNGNGLVIEAYGVPYNTWIAMTEPMPDEPWVEYEPHGLVFTSPQYARISYAGCELPAGMNPDDLEIWYWNEKLGQYEYVGGDNHIEEEYIEFDIEHFSRYVVAGEE